MEHGVQWLDFQKSHRNNQNTTASHGRFLGAPVASFEPSSGGFYGNCEQRRGEYAPDPSGKAAVLVTVDLAGAILVVVAVPTRRRPCSHRPFPSRSCFRASPLTPTTRLKPTHAPTPLVPPRRGTRGSAIASCLAPNLSHVPT